MTSKVYVIKDDGRRDLVPATKFGEIVVISNAEYPNYGSSVTHINKINSCLKRFNPEVDYLVLVGDPMSIGIAMYFALQQCKKVKCLKWDRQTRDYNVIEVQLP